MSRRIQDVLKTSSRPIAKTSSRRPQYVSKTPCENVFKTFWRRLQNIFKMSSRHFEDVFKTSSRNIQDILQKCLQDVFKTYHQVKLFLLTRLREVFNTFLRHTVNTVSYRRIYLGHTSEKFMVSVKTLLEW